MPAGKAPNTPRQQKAPSRTDAQYRKAPSSLREITAESLKGEATTPAADADSNNHRYKARRYKGYRPALPESPPPAVVVTTDLEQQEGYVISQPLRYLLLPITIPLICLWWVTAIALFYAVFPGFLIVPFLLGSYISGDRWWGLPIGCALFIANLYLWVRIAEHEAFIARIWEFPFSLLPSSLRSDFGNAPTSLNLESRLRPAIRRCAKPASSRRKNDSQTAAEIQRKPRPISTTTKTAERADHEGGVKVRSELPARISPPAASHNEPRHLPSPPVVWRPTTPEIKKSSSDEADVVMRAAVPATPVTLLHRRMQGEIFECLMKAAVPGRSVRLEVYGIDILVNDSRVSTVIEIKTGDNIILVIREAVGQLLEYRYFCRHEITNLVVQLLIVSPLQLTPTAAEYIKHLRSSCGLRIGYAQYVPGSNFFTL